jgi:protein-tyrosine phosphatase
VADTSPHTFRILVVCTANQCRSPAAERILRHLLVGNTPSRFEIESVGTEGPEGYPMHPLTRAGLQRRGIAGEDHVARVLAPQHLERASLVLAAERSHRAKVAMFDLDMARRSFTLMEFARLSMVGVRLGVMSPDELVAAVAALRVRMPPSAPGHDDLVDPIRTGGDDHESMLMAAQRAVAVIADALVVAAAPAIELRPTGRRALAW